MAFKIFCVLFVFVPFFLFVLEDLFASCYDFLTYLWLCNLKIFIMQRQDKTNPVLSPQANMPPELQNVSAQEAISIGFDVVNRAIVRKSRIHYANADTQTRLQQLLFAVQKVEALESGFGLRFVSPSNPHTHI